MNEQKTYTPYVPDDLVKMLNGDTVAALLACKIGTFADEKGTIFVSFSFLSELWNIDIRKIRNAADKLALLQIWNYKRGDGRGHVTEWKKGANYDTFVILKRVQNLQIKGAKIATYNKDIINNKKRAYARRDFKFIKDNSPKSANMDDPNNPTGVRKGVRISHDQYYKIFGDDVCRNGWKWYKPAGECCFIFEKL